MRTIKPMKNTSLLLTLCTLCTLCSAQSRPFVALTAASAAATVVDALATNHCIAAHTCREGNPLLPQAGGPRTALMFGEWAAESALSYRLWRRGSRTWLVAPMAAIAAHGVGFGITVSR